MAVKPRGRPKAFDDKTDQNTVQALDRALVPAGASGAAARG
jgi:IclR family transcriptional regulator, acetate operon repressor